MKMVNAYYSLGYLLECLVRPTSVCAVLVIVCVQYRSSVADLIYTAQEDGILQTLLNSLLSLADIVRAYYHIAREVVRNFGQNSLFLFGDGTGSGNYARFPLTEREVSVLENKDSTNAPIRRGNKKRLSSVGQPPPLVVVDNASINEGDEPAAASSPVTSAKPTEFKVRNELMPLEPAFLNSDDYPEGWLVYHPVLGVISVKEAERYEDQQQLIVTETEKHQHSPEIEMRNRTKSEHEMDFGPFETPTTGNTGS
mmetsp:Transcript_29178/g.78958  ORF Transcript_29178/g.78958 Transcript_29178/m.78958 type:complete len:254 (-) Transcript_29178:1856-2617(-)